MSKIPTADEVLTGYALSALEEEGETGPTVRIYRAIKLRELAQEWYSAEIAKAKAEALLEAAQSVRSNWNGSTNLPDEEDPHTYYSFDVWLEKRAEGVK